MPDRTGALESTLERSLYKDEIDQQINSIVASYRANVLAAYDQLIKEGKEPTCFAIKHRLENPSGNARMFLVEFGKYCDKRQKEVGTRITQLTANKYHRLLRYLKEYMQAQYKKEDIPLDMVNYEYLDGLNTFIQTAHNCKTNGAVNLLCCLKNFMLYAIRNEWIEKNPFQYYKLKPEHNKSKDHLTKAELDVLITKPMPNERIERIRDVFAFCCLTGLAFTGCRPPAPGAYQRRRQRAIVDSQTPRENRRNEPHPLITAPGETPAKVRVRPELPTARKDVTCTEQFEDERLPERAGGHLQYRKDADNARRAAYVRLFGG